ncbi:hypothetical protein M5K25_015386 [Dendrobium thyrsiflorum]|uniref:Peptide N-acetyl-beta-D-glucosaminyl asparaginase amidase A N-terminal domain-containing protein n=1 Tax=Dendrobium thyrsiflorum TaxID=117978 RepID=A0ABD0UX19_DENTH
MSPSIALLLLLMLGGGGAATAFAFPFPPPPAIPSNSTLEYIDPTLPPLHPTHNPKCSITILQHDFADTAGAPPVSVPYYPPADCPAPWSRVVLELSGSASDIQKDRIAAIWLSGAELLRTSTPFPLSPGVFWRVQKDITRYTALLRSPSPDDNSTDAEAAAAATATISMMLENSNASLPGVYSVNISLHFYRGAVAQLNSHPIIKGLYREPADLILPISNEVGECGPGYWFKLHNESDVQLTSLSIPNNTYRAVLELYVSHHADDEYWYANPLRSTEETKLMSLSSSLLSSPFRPKANGGFRQVELTIDKLYAGAVVPFPVIYPGSINPFFWAPVAGIAAYDLPSYDLDLTPFVGLLVDGREHEFRLIIRDSQPFWLVSGNLHLWLDAWSDRVEGKLVRHRVPPLRLSRQADWRGSDGKSSIDGQVIVRFAGWVSSSKGNVSTSIRQRLKFKSRVEIQRKGVVKQAVMESNLASRKYKPNDTKFDSIRAQMSPNQGPEALLEGSNHNLSYQTVSKWDSPHFSKRGGLRGEEEGEGKRRRKGGKKLLLDHRRIVKQRRIKLSVSKIQTQRHQIRLNPSPNESKSRTRSAIGRFKPQFELPNGFQMGRAYSRIERLDETNPSSPRSLNSDIIKTSKWGLRGEEEGEGKRRRKGGKKLLLDHRRIDATEVKSRTDVRSSLNRGVVGRASVSVEAPLMVTTEKANGGGGTVLERTKIFHAMTEGRSVGGKGEMEFSEVADKQDSEGSVLVGEEGMVWGSGDTSSLYKFRDEKACYLRTVKVVGGRVKEDVETASCAGAAVAEL